MVSLVGVVGVDVDVGVGVCVGLGGFFRSETLMCARANISQSA
jgi:hypothetical protein